MTTNVEQPKPCPFCGGADLGVHVALLNPDDDRVECTQCGARGPRRSVVKGDDQALVAAWNRRPIEEQLLDACEWALGWQESYHAMDFPREKRLRNAIAKARGKTEGGT